MLRCRRGERCLKVGTRLTSDARRSGRGHRYREQLYGRELKTKNAKRTVSCTRRSARPRARYDRRKLDPHAFASRTCEEPIRRAAFSQLRYDAVRKLDPRIRPPRLRCEAHAARSEPETGRGRAPR